MALKGFDMVWAITQNTINSQLEWLQSQGYIADKLSFGDLDTVGAVVGGSGEDAAVLAPPTVSFDTGENNVIRLILQFTGGTVTVYQGFGRNAKPIKYPLKGDTIAFKVNLAIGQLAHEHLANDKAVPPSVAKILSQFDPSQFEVQSIFMDFENSDLANYDTTYSRMQFPDEMSATLFKNAMAAWINSHRGNDNPFILGHAVKQRTAQDRGGPSVLEPTGANFSAHVFAPIKGANDPNAGLSTFNFLLVTGGRDILKDPMLYGAGAGVFDFNLVDANDVDGRGYIALDTFLHTYLEPLIIAPLTARLNQQRDYVHARDDRRPHVEINEKTAPDRNRRATFVRTPRGWTYKDHVKLTWHEPGSHSHDRESEQSLEFSVQLVMSPDSGGTPRLTLQIDGSLYRYEWDQLNIDMPFKSNVYVGKGWASARLPWTIKIQFVAGADGKLTVTKSSHAGEPQKDSGKAGGYKVADFFSGLLNLHSIADDWRNNAAGLGAVEKTILGAIESGVSDVLNGAATKVVMPAPRTFFYKNLALGHDGDVRIDLTYKAQ